MRRAIAAIAGTTVGLVLLLGYKSGPVRPAPRRGDRRPTSHHRWR